MRRRGFQIALGSVVALAIVVVWRAWVLVEQPYRRATAEIAVARGMSDGYPAILTQAVLAAEDPAFMEDGRLITLKRIFRTGHASLSSQFVRRFIEPSRASAYAVQWWLTAALVDLTASRDDIIGAYLRGAYTGSMDGSPMCGFSEAARRYFDKQVGELTIAESAILAGLLRSPSQYSPLTQPAAAEQRALAVLDAMRQRRFISEEEFDESVRGLPSELPCRAAYCQGGDVTFQVEQ